MRASDCHPLGTKRQLPVRWALTFPRERQPENIRSRSVIESYIRTRHELAPVRYSPSCAVVPARYSNPTALVLAKKGNYSSATRTWLCSYSSMGEFKKLVLARGRVRARCSFGHVRIREVPVAVAYPKSNSHMNSNSCAALAPCRRCSTPPRCRRDRRRFVEAAALRAVRRADVTHLVARRPRAVRYAAHADCRCRGVACSKHSRPRQLTAPLLEATVASLTSQNDSHFPL